ncbi:MAG: hypothetical protein ACHREM_18185 [Polyangiales bacterium]
MAGYVLLVTPPTLIDIGSILATTGTNGYNLTLARRIDTSQAEEVALGVRVHSLAFGTGTTTINCYLAQDGYTSEDPQSEYGPYNASNQGPIAPASIQIATVAIGTTYPSFTLAQATPAPAGGLVQVFLNIARANAQTGNPFFVRLSVELHMKTGSTSAYAPAAGSYLGCGMRRV